MVSLNRDAAPVEFVSPPYAGHLHPILGIARETAARGIPVRVRCTPSQRQAIEAAGLVACTVDHADEGMIAFLSDPGHRLARNPVTLVRHVRTIVSVWGDIRGQLDAEYRTSPPAVVVADFTLPVAGFAAESVGARWITAIPSPSVLGGPNGTPSMCGGLRPPRGRLGHVRDAAARAGVRLFKEVGFALNRPAMMRIGFERLTRADGSEAQYSPECILATGLPELEFPRTWPVVARFTGAVTYAPPGRPGAWGCRCPTCRRDMRIVVLGCWCHVARC